ncbi:NAD(P)-binding domain-containing protein [Fusarium pseudoanthophilum]|uniref:NAD(P)-binding domain-containing protein n=1 Tax=Fusarium pseudoanthophilum TaxID=48495 RepID=A0A8H5KPL6_9HYPO|nr:NAD(P)-binding domain-containing protein [Fusarium pseudoanthophilum]
MSIRTVGVIGTGVIGASWAGLFLAHGLRVLVSDPAPNAEKGLKDAIQTVLPTLKAIHPDSNIDLSKLEFVGPSLGDRLGEVDFIQENAPERTDLKIKLIAELDAGARPGVLIASSSSGIPSSQFISNCAKNPGRVLIGHPFNPPHLMPLVEVVPHPGTDSKSVDVAVSFYKSLGKTPVVIQKEVPGFAANRLQAVLCNEVYSLVSNGVMSAKDVGKSIIAALVNEETRSDCLDTCVTSSLGPRWAVTGPLMSNAMGGGGGRDGFRHLLEHLGPASQQWLEHIKANSFQWNAESLDKLTESVGEELQGADVRELEKERDRLLVEILKLKGSI